jgi:hypothetical protein
MAILYHNMIYNAILKYDNKIKKYALKRLCHKGFWDSYASLSVKETLSSKL